MHMADALISPAVGGSMWAAAGGLIAHSARKLRQTTDDRRVPLMGVLGAFVFAAQMINFTIPGTGSSGHIGGGLLLAILLGSPAAFVTIASILLIQALFFADGGLLALGCNIVNMGLFPCFLVYPFIYRPLVGAKPSPGRLTWACILCAVLGLQLGAFSVVMETTLSGITELPFGKLVMLMQPIHLAIGIIEGLIIAAVVNFIRKARPEVLELSPAGGPGRAASFRPVLIGLLLAALATGGVVSWFASKNPDGLEWAIGKLTGKSQLPVQEDTVHLAIRHVQQNTAIMPDYDFRTQEPATVPASPPAPPASPEHHEPSWGAPSAGTSLAGVVGGAAALVLAMGVGWALRPRKV